MKRFRIYTAYSVALGIVWVVLLPVVPAVDPSSRFHNALWVFAGFAVGWISATIARYVYPPPAKHRLTGQQRG